MAPDDDAPFDAALAAVTADAWTELFAALDALDGATDLATWAGGTTIAPAAGAGGETPVLQMPYPVYSEEVDRLRRAIGACGLVIPFDWMGWEGIARHRGGRAMAEASAADAVRMITAVIRSERFTDGSIEGALRDGTLQAALRRLRDEHG